MSPQSTPREPAEYLAYFVLLLAEIVFALALALWLAGEVAGVLSGHGWPHSSPTDSLAIVRGMLKSPGDPARAWPAAAAAAVGPAWLVYLIFVLLLVFVGYLTFEFVRFVLNFRRRQPYRWFRLGFASGDELRRTLGAKALLRNAETLRPSLKGRRNIEPTDVGFCLGRDVRSRQRVFSAVNEAIMFIAPPKQGREGRYADPFTIDAPGACIHTSLGSDAAPSFVNTYASRAKKGTVWVFDPIGLTNWPARFRWSPVSGAEEPRVANERARAFVSGAGFTTSGEGANFVNAAIMVLRSYLHAAALSGKTLHDIIRWSTRPTDPEPVRLLQDAEAAGAGAAGWAMALEAAGRSNAEHTGAVWSTVVQALNSFSDPKVLEACSPGPGDIFDLREFLAGQNTLYVFGDRTVTPVATAMMEDLMDRIFRLARHLPNARVDPPLTIEFNDVGSIAPLPNMATYMGEVAYHSIAMHLYLSSLTSARSVWGAGGAMSLWEMSAVRVVLGGGGNIADLDEISKLFGELPNKSRGGDNLVSTRVLPPEELRVLPPGRGVVLARNVRPVEVKIPALTERKDYPEIAAGKEQTERMIQSYTEAAQRNDQFVRYARMNSPGWGHKRGLG